jgi:hypothetical protein
MGAARGTSYVFFRILLAPKLCLGAHGQAKLCFAGHIHIGKTELPPSPLGLSPASAGNRVSKTLVFPNRVWEQETYAQRPTPQIIITGFSLGLSFIFQRREY